MHQNSCIFELFFVILPLKMAKMLTLGIARKSALHSLNRIFVSVNPRL